MLCLDVNYPLKTACKFFIKKLKFFKIFKLDSKILLNVLKLRNLQTPFPLKADILQKPLNLLKNIHL